MESSNKGVSFDRIIYRIPPPYNSSSVYSNISQFDEDVQEYCKSLKLSNNNSEVRVSKIIIIGDMGVGKTSIVQRFVNNSFNKDYKATIGVDFEIERFQILKIPFNIQIWDTAGQERFKCIASGAQAIILTFDLIDQESLLNTERWLKDALDAFKIDEKFPFIFLVGTKKDLLDLTSNDNKEKTNQLAIEFARRINAEYWQVSSLNGENITQFFSRLSSLLFNNSIKNELEQNNLYRSKKSIGGSAFVETRNQYDSMNRDSIRLTEREKMEQIFGNKCCKL